MLTANEVLNMLRGADMDLGRAKREVSDTNAAKLEQARDLIVQVIEDEEK